MSPDENSLAAFYNNPDKALNTCILQWNLNTLKGKWELGITEAPIFFPCRHTKFFSEHLLAHMVYAYPVSMFGASPQKIYNLTYQLNRITIGVAASLLCLELGAAFLPALLAGGLLITSWKLGQLQNTGLCWALFAMLFFVKQTKNSRWRYAIAIALFITLTGLSSGYLAFYTPLALLVLLIAWVIYTKQWPTKAWFCQMSLALLLVSLALAPTMMSYRKVQKDYGLVRERYSVAELVLPFETHKTLHGGNSQEQIALTPPAGVEVLLFACAVVLILRRRLKYNGWEWGFAALAIVSFWMAFYDVSPYWLIANLPGFNGLRAAYRWYFIWISALTVIVSMVLTTLTEKQQPWKKIVLLGTIVSLLISTISSTEPEKPVERLPESRVYAFLRTIKPGPVCILPVLPRTKMLTQIVNSARMLYQLSYSFPMVSGYSGFVPDITRSIERVLVRDGPSPSVITKLAKTGVRYIVLDNLLEDTSGISSQLKSEKRCKVIYEQNGEMVVELPAVAVEPEPKDLWRKPNNKE